MRVYDIAKKSFSTKAADFNKLKKDSPVCFSLPSDTAEIKNSVDSIGSVPLAAEKSASSKFQQVKDYLSNFWSDFIEKDIKPYNAPFPDTPDEKVKHLDEPKNFKEALMAVPGGAGWGPLAGLIIKRVKGIFSKTEDIKSPEKKEEKSYSQVLKNVFTAMKEEVKEIFNLQPTSPDDKDSKLKRLGRNLLAYCEPRPNAKGADNFKEPNFLSGIIGAVLGGGIYSRIIPGVIGTFPGITSILPGIIAATAGASLGILVEKKTKSFFAGVAASLLSGGATGAVIGALVGGPVGAAVGGLLGALSAAVGVTNSNKFASIRDGNNDGLFIELPFRLITAGNPLDDLGAGLAGSLGGRALKTKKGKLFLGAIAGTLVGIGIACISPYGSVLGSVLRCAVCGSIGSITSVMRVQAQRNILKDFNNKIETLNSEQPDSIEKSKKD